MADNGGIFIPTPFLGRTLDILRSMHRLRRLVPIRYLVGVFRKVLFLRPAVLICASLALALLLSGIAVAYSIRSGKGLEEDLRTRSFLSAQAFAQAATMWLDARDRETLSRVADLMLSGSSLYVQIVYDGVAVIDRPRADSGVTPPPLSSFVEGGASRIAFRSEGGGPLVDVTIPLHNEEGSASDGYIRVGFDASPLAGRAAANDLRIALIGAGLWFLPVGLVFALRIRLRPMEIHEMPPPARGDRSADELIVRGELSIDRAAREVHFGGIPLRLTPKLFELLWLLASDENRVFSETEIIAAVWADSPYADSTDVRQGIRRLRQRLKDTRPGGERCVVNVKGFGYRFEPSPSSGEGRTQGSTPTERSAG